MENMITRNDDPIIPTSKIGSLKGLTKREYFAAMAMQGALANKSAHERTIEMITESSVKLADSLIEELNKIK